MKEEDDDNEYLDMLIRINIHSRALETASPGTRVTRKQIISVNYQYLSI